MPVYWGGELTKGLQSTASFSSCLVFTFHAPQRSKATYKDLCDCQPHFGSANFNGYALLEEVTLSQWSNNAFQNMFSGFRSYPGYTFILQPFIHRQPQWH